MTPFHLWPQSEKIPYLISQLRQTQGQQQTNLLRDMAREAGSLLKLGEDWDISDTECNISLAVNIVAEKKGSKRQQAAAQVLALCSKLIEAEDRYPDAIEQLREHLYGSVGFNDVAQSERAKLPRKRQIWLREAVRILAKDRIKQSFSELMKSLEAGVTLADGEFVIIEVCRFSGKIESTTTVVEGETPQRRSVSEKTIRCYFTKERNGAAA